MATEDSGEERPSKRNAIVTYREVAEIHVKLAEIAAKLDAVPALGGDLVKLEVRVRALELSQAAASSRSGTWANALTIVNTVILTGIAILTYLAANAN